MTNRRMVIGGAMLLVALAGVLVYVLMSGTDSDSTGGPATLPEIDMEADTSVVDTTAPVLDMEPIDEAEPMVDPELTATDPVPDEIVTLLFDKLSAVGAAPMMNETYTVEFVDETDRVRILGRFEAGEATYVFVYVGDVWSQDGGL